jgi:hypothetical protein
VNDVRAFVQQAQVRLLKRFVREAARAVRLEVLAKAVGSTPRPFLPFRKSIARTVRVSHSASHSTDAS